MYKKEYYFSFVKPKQWQWDKVKGFGGSIKFLGITIKNICKTLELRYETHSFPQIQLYKEKTCGKDFPA
jgi:hypothetical protein